MDWHSLATLLANRYREPLALLDRSYRIRLVNTQFVELVGRSRAEITGQPWMEALSTTEEAALTKQWLDDAFRGAIRSHACEITTSRRERLAVRLDLALVGTGRRLNLLVVVKSSRLLSRACAGDFDYEISSEISRFGQLRKIICFGTDQPIAGAVGELCYEVFRGRSSVCAGCPAHEPASVPWPRIAVRRTKDGAAFEVITAQAVEESVIRLSVRAVSNAMLDRVFRARLDELAEQAALSERERAVLTYLAMGRSLEDIAVILGIGVRTVKFHQANILEKLGADSRVDLMRLIF